MKRTSRGWLTLLGLSGGLAFVVGSVLFLNPDRYTEGVYLFIFGSVAMLVERLGKLWLGGEG
ncbi:YrhK family protein [Oceanithermus sp.]|uniref:YrhK family protein n=1 Tax=Oceanithermus sp. TaxID=2268145 RepID=UPI0025EEFABC|nr:YrhK family protein [Oceanithermus sp.]